MVKINVLLWSLCMLHVLYIILMNTINKKKFMFLFYSRVSNVQYPLNASTRRTRVICLPLAAKKTNSNVAELFIFAL